MRLVKTYRNRSTKKKRGCSSIRDDIPNLALSHSISDLTKLSKASQSRKFDPCGFSKRALEWKRSKDQKIESKRKRKEEEEISHLEMNATANKKLDKLSKTSSKIYSMKNHPKMNNSESICPNVKARNIEKRAKMRLKLTNRNRSKSKHAMEMVEQAQRYAKGNLTQRFN